MAGLPTMEKNYNEVQIIDGAENTTREVLRDLGTQVLRMMGKLMEMFHWWNSLRIFLLRQWKELPSTRNTV